VSAFPGQPKLLRGGLVLVDIDTAQVQRVVTLQYNPDSLTRTLQVQGASGDTQDHLEALRLKGPPIETIKLDAELDATDQLEFPDQNPNAVTYGLHPQLAALETIVYPTAQQTLETYQQSQAGAMEVLPLTAPLQLFVWSPRRVLPVRITDFSVTEEQFSTQLNPVRAKVSLSMRVLNVNDIGFDNKGGSLFMIHMQQKEQLAKLAAGALATLGLRGLP
jgi:hypothetical protein